MILKRKKNSPGFWPGLRNSYRFRYRPRETLFRRVSTHCRMYRSAVGMGRPTSWAVALKSFASNSSGRGRRMTSTAGAPWPGQWQPSRKSFDDAQYVLLEQFADGHRGPVIHVVADARAFGVSVLKYPQR